MSQHQHHHNSYFSISSKIEPVLFPFLQSEDPWVFLAFLLVVFGLGVITEGLQLLLKRNFYYKSEYELDKMSIFI